MFDIEQSMHMKKKTLCAISNTAYNSLTTIRACARALNDDYFRPGSHDRSFIEFPWLETVPCSIGLKGNFISENRSRGLFIKKGPKNCSS